MDVSRTSEAREVLGAQHFHASAAGLKQELANSKPKEDDDQDNDGEPPVDKGNKYVDRSVPESALASWDVALPRKKSMLRVEVPQEPPHKTPLIKSLRLT